MLSTRSANSSGGSSEKRSARKDYSYSVMLNYYDKVPDDKSKVICKLCSVQIVSHGSTTRLRTHLRARHPEAYQVMVLEIKLKRLEEEAIQDEKERDRQNSYQGNSGNEEECSVTVSAPKPRAGLKTQSIVWEYFEETLRPDKAVCRKCQVTCSICSGSTTNMLRHLRAKHPTDYQNSMAKKKLQYATSYNAASIEISKKQASSESELDTSQLSDLPLPNPTVTAGNSEVGFTVPKKSPCKKTHSDKYKNKVNKFSKKIDQQNSYHVSSGSEEEDSVSASAPKARARKLTGKRIQSVVWEYFSETRPDRVVCRICCVSFSNQSSSTSNLLRHLRAKHLKACKNSIVKKNPQLASAFNETIGISEIQASSESEEMDTSQLSDLTLPNPTVSDGNSEVQTRKLTGKKFQSVVWEYFRETRPDKVVCMKCHASFSFHSNCTSNLVRHLRAKHLTAYKNSMVEKNPLLASAFNETIEVSEIQASCESEMDTSQLSDLTLPNPTVSAGNSEAGFKLAEKSPCKKTNSDKYKTKVNKSLIKLISVNLLPPSIVENEEFKEMLKALDGRYQLPTKSFVMKTLLPEFSSDIKNKLRRDIDIASHLALTVETWKYRHSKPCMTVMTHFITDFWDTSSVVLETFESQEEMTGANLIEELRRITDEWGIGEKVVTLVSDPSEMLSTAAVTMGWEHLFCFGEKLNSVILTALESVPEVTKLVKKVSEIGEYFSKSMKASDCLLTIQKQHSQSEHRLKREIGNKWMTTYYMIERMSEQFEAANTVLCYHHRDDMCVCDDEVELLRSVVDLLQPFETVVTEILSSVYTSMSKVIPFKNILQEVVGNYVDESMTSSVSVLMLRDFLLHQLESQFNIFERNSTSAMCTLLDPRFKHHAFTDNAAMDAAKDQLLQEMSACAKYSPEESTNVIEESVCKSKSPIRDIWSSFDKRVTDAGASQTVSSAIENESRRYFKEALISRSQDPLQWWKLNQVQFPHLQVLAKKYLCIPATSVCSSRLFSKKGEEFNIRRSMIKPSDLDTMLFLSSNVHMI